MRPVTGDEDARELARLAAEIWFGYWPPLIGEAQTRYMVERFQSEEAIRRDMAEHGYEYWFVADPATGGVVGYTGGRPEPEAGRFFISKIYLMPAARGRHLASAVVRFYDVLCRERGLRSMYLTVNKGNDLGIRAYRGNGFKVVDAVESDIGHGFVMDDYIMERAVSPEGPAA